MVNKPGSCLFVFVLGFVSMYVGFLVGLGVFCLVDCVAFFGNQDSDLPFLHWSLTTLLSRPFKANQSMPENLNTQLPKNPITFRRIENWIKENIHFLGYKPLICIWLHYYLGIHNHYIWGKLQKMSWNFKQFLVQLPNYGVMTTNYL